MGRVDGHKKRGRAPQFVYHSEANQLRREGIVLVAFKSLSVTPFQLPFSGVKQIRDASRLKVRSLMGEALAKVFLVPLIVSKKGKGANGSVFFLQQDEFQSLELAGTQQDALFWPIPLLFVSEVGGNGVILWQDEQQLCSLWVENWIPLLYRNVMRYEGDVQAEKTLFQEFAHAQGKEIKKTLLFDCSAPIQEIGERTLAACPVYRTLDLSPSGANTAEQLDRFWGQLHGFMRTALVAGLLFCLLSGALLAQRIWGAADFSSLPGAVYAASFGEKSNSPLKSARQKTSSQSEDSGDSSFPALLQTILVSIKETAQADLRLDSLRYGEEKTEIQGSAKSTSEIQHLREGIGSAGFDVKTGEITQIPGGGFRFSLVIQGGRP